MKYEQLDKFLYEQKVFQCSSLVEGIYSRFDGWKWQFIPRKSFNKQKQKFLNVLCSHKEGIENKWKISSQNHTKKQNLKLKLHIQLIQYVNAKLEQVLLSSDESALQTFHKINCTKKLETTNLYEKCFTTSNNEYIWNEIC